MNKSLSIKRKKEKDTFVWIYFGITSIEIVASRQIKLLLFEEFVQGRHQDEEEKEHFALAGLLLLLKVEPKLRADKNSLFSKRCNLCPSRSPSGLAGLSS